MCKEEYEQAIKKLIDERDMAIVVINNLLCNECNRYYCADGDAEECSMECRWRGAKR